MTDSSRKTRASYRPIHAVDVASIRQMYALYDKYYERTSLEIFLSDLSKKSGVILIQRAGDGAESPRFSRRLQLLRR